jgi:hypothetical protein
MEPAKARTFDQEAIAFEDGFGTRGRSASATHRDELETLYLRNELTTVPSFEFALRERVNRLAHFHHPSYGAVHSVERLERAGSTLGIVSDQVPGVRLSEILAAVERRALQLDIDAAIALIRQLVPAAAALHEQAPDVVHGAIGPERIVVTPDAQLVIVEYVLGGAVERLQYSQARYWNDLRVAVPQPGASCCFDRRADVTQIGLVALALILGRRIGPDEFPTKIGSAVRSAWASANGGLVPLPAGLRWWLSRALQLDARNSFASCADANAELDTFIESRGAADASSALETLVKCHSSLFIAEQAARTPGAALVEGPPTPGIGTPQAAPSASIPAVEAPLPIETAGGERPPEGRVPDRTGPDSSRPAAHEDRAMTAHGADIGPPAADAPAASRASAAYPAAPTSHPTDAESRSGTAPVTPPPSMAGKDQRPTAIEPASAPVALPLKQGIEPAAAVLASKGRVVETAAAPATAPKKQVVQAAGPPVAGPAEASRASVLQTAGAIAAPKKAGGQSAAPATPSPATSAAPASRSHHPLADAFDEAADDIEDDRTNRRRRPSLPLAVSLVIVLAAVGAFGARRYLLGADRTSSGTAIITTDPTGVPVMIDGQPMGSTPLRATLRAGTHSLELLGGSERRQIPLTVAAGAQVAQYIELRQAQVGTGQVEVRTEPPGARVAVDGQLRGTTPLTIDELTPGDHTVTLEGESRSLSQHVTIEAGATNSLIMSLAGSPGDAPPSGWVSVTTPVDTQLYENGRLIGNSRIDRIMMPAGRHEVEVVNETLQYRAKRTVDVAAGKVSPIKPEWPKGTLSLNALPWAEVWVDGEKIGETPIGNLSLPIGPHEIVFRHPELGQRTYAVSTLASSPTRLSVDLTSK